MPTIILCGGQGTRLREETEFKPKPMVEIGDKPILWHIMKLYAHFGYNNFILALGYKGEHIKNYFLNIKNYISDFSLNPCNGEICYLDDSYYDDFNITFAHTGLDTPHGERVLMAQPYIKDDIFMVTYGDGVANINIDELVKFHIEKKVIATITGVHPISRWGLVNIDMNDRVTEFSQKPALFDYTNGGFMVFNKKLLDYLKPGYMIEDVFPQLIAEKQLALYRHEGFWFGMDTYKDMLTLNDLWKKGAPWKIWK
ncbi:MAG: glucose-1-phosphate cytidylyltransferase [Parcubacteria group bacterium]|nr:glucose-1-phosphate cytidylyltransferase [Parcubacteria group bacterium]